MRKALITGILSAASLAYMAASANASTLDDVKKKGFVQCGVNTGLAGFAAPDSKGNWQGFDVDICRAVAAAIFGDGNKVKFTTSISTPAPLTLTFDVTVTGNTMTGQVDAAGLGVSPLTGVRI